MRPLIPFLFAVLFAGTLSAQDTVYARKVIRHLCSKECFGRGYIRQGLAKAEKFIVKELKAQGTSPLFDNSYTQVFSQPVNTFPGTCKVRLNGKTLVTGLDFIPDPGSTAIKGTFQLVKVDSVNYIATEGTQKIMLILKNKLTFSVARKQDPFSGIEVDRRRFQEEPKELEITLQSKFIPDFQSRNIACSIKGTSASDSLIVFSAHYDHLGGIGKQTFFPGANDNASGVSALLNLIKHYSKQAPRYTTVFIFFAGEEAGLLGSSYFTQHPPFDLKKIKFLINLDLLGTGDDGIMVVNGAIHEKEFARLTRLNTELQLCKDIRKRGKAANSDHYWFSEAGVPCFFIYTLGGISAYHDVRDVAATLPLTDYVDVLKLITAFVDSF